MDYKFLIESVLIIFKEKKKEKENIIYCTEITSPLFINIFYKFITKLNIEVKKRAGEKLKIKRQFNPMIK